MWVILYIMINIIPIQAERNDSILIKHIGISDKPIQTVVIVEGVICNSEIRFFCDEQENFEIAKRISVTSETFTSIRNILIEFDNKENNFNEHDPLKFGSFMFTINRIQ
ncbi:MAG TPA: hypothetical protein PLS84_09570 [Salinivirgaceae bacterium]|nr:MAG: hypothetical protein BWY08_00188 [Bacteroidetes bacterium ADurb.Bin174]HPW67307.1 hypothetical protein [Salinivirgaceae bacterium]